MINLGKILFLSLVAVTATWANFQVKASDTNIHQGDQVVVTFVSTISDKLPRVSDIGGVAVQSTSQSSSTSYINGRRTAQYTLRYVISPMRSFTIPSYTMKEQGQVVHSKPIDISVVKRTQTIHSDLYFDVKSSKKEVYEGEPFVVTLTYKQNKNLDIVDLRLSPPKGKNFWIDSKNVKEDKMQTATHDVYTFKYLFTAQKSGDLTIDAAQVQVGQRSYQRDAWGMLGMAPKYKSLFSNPINIKVLPLPTAAQTIGSFTFDAVVDKTSSDEKNAVNLTLAINGTGNVEDIEPFELQVPHALVYDEKPKRTSKTVNGKVKGLFTQKFAIVSDENYTIPALHFSYFDKKKKKLITLATKPISITIIPTATAPSSEHVFVEKASSKAPQEKSTAVVGSYKWYELTGILVLGMMLGYLLRGIKFRGKRTKKTPKKTINASDKKAMLQSFLPYASKNEQAALMVKDLEEAIYKNKTVQHSKKEMVKLLKQLSNS